MCDFVATIQGGRSLTRASSALYDALAWGVHRGDAWADNDRRGDAYFAFCEGNSAPVSRSLWCRGRHRRWAAVGGTGFRSSHGHARFWSLCTG